MNNGLNHWFERLGYDAFPQALHYSSEAINRTHPYSVELNALMDPHGQVRALAVFEIDGVPCVCFVADDGDKENYANLQAKVWNQGLISLVLVLGEEELRALPTVPGVLGYETLSADAASPSSTYSAWGIQSSQLIERHPDWFQPDKRVDRALLKNLQLGVLALKDLNYAIEDAQYLMAQILFVSYLEHRGIIGDEYRSVRKVRSFHELVRSRDHKGLAYLFTVLKQDFNGDFLEPRSDSTVAWHLLSEGAFAILDDFLSHTDLQTKQQSFWGYDFNYIPVELLSGLYESFLGEDKSSFGAYYTPRHLANLAVEEAFRGLDDITQQIVCDGACGSGILLTTAFRRMLGVAEAKAGAALPLKVRSDLLVGHIFGGDVNKSACQVTVFSLYLSLLENLIPKDIISLTDEAHVRLPNLLGKNIFYGSAGDFFGDGYLGESIHSIPKPTILISNPPWKRSPEVEVESFEKWIARSSHYNVTQNQIAIAYAYRASEVLAAQARICLLMPAGSFLKASNAAFVETWLNEVNLLRLINFSDLRNLLFPAAKHPCVLAVAETQNIWVEAGRQTTRTFDYFVPKADLSLAYGRLTIHASDRHKLAVSHAQLDPGVLRNLYWGSKFEMAQLAILRMRGIIGNLSKGKEARFVARKGFHLTDNNRPKLSAERFRSSLFIHAKKFPSKGPYLHSSLLEKFPAEYLTVGDYGSDELYEGARVIFPDGLTTSRRIRACFANRKFNFSNSLGCIRDRQNDDNLMRFLAAYLSSDLATYFVLLTAPTAVLERTQIKVSEVEELPFYLPEDHPNPERAQAIVAEIAAILKKGEDRNLDDFMSVEESTSPIVERLLAEYFDISGTLSQVIREVNDIVIQAVQPTTLKWFPTALQRMPVKSVLEDYAQTLTLELRRYRDQLQGNGDFETSVRYWHAGAADGLGIVTIRVTDSNHNNISSNVVAEAVDVILERLRELDLLQGITQGGLALASDVLVQSANEIIFAKPLIHRLWLTSAALDDAVRILASAQSKTEAAL